MALRRASPRDGAGIERVTQHRCHVSCSAAGGAALDMPAITTAAHETMQGEIGDSSLISSPRSNDPGQAGCGNK
jgi:hypothetical protein